MSREAVHGDERGVDDGDASAGDGPGELAEEVDVDVGDALGVAAGGDYLYVAGYTRIGPYGNQDVLLLKYDQEGNLLWSQDWGGAGKEWANAVAVMGEKGDCLITPGRQIMYREITVIGSLYFDRSDVPGMLDLYRRGLPVDPLVTHRFPIHQAPEAFATFASGQSGKVLIVHSDLSSVG